MINFLWKGRRGKIERKGQGGRKPGRKAAEKAGRVEDGIRLRSSPVGTLAKTSDQL